MIPGNNLKLLFRKKWLFIKRRDRDIISTLKLAEWVDVWLKIKLKYFLRTTLVHVFYDMAYVPYCTQRFRWFYMSLRGMSLNGEILLKYDENYYAEFYEQM